MRSTFYHEKETKAKLCAFILAAEKLSMGEMCKKFETGFASWQGRKHAVLFNSGSSANLAVIQALLNLGKLKKGDEVGFSALTWATNVMPLIQLGLVPIPIDVNFSTLNVSSQDMTSVMKNHRLKAFFLTNLLGFCADIAAIEQICKERGVILLEDNCESLGSRCSGRLLGNFSYASTFSSFVGHHVSTIEGGIVCTDDEDMLNMLTMVRAHGWDRNLPAEKQASLRNTWAINDFHGKYSFYVPGYNLRPTEITGFLGVEQLPYLHEITKKRAANFKRFQEAASSNAEVYPLDVNHMEVVSNFAYPLICKDTARFEDYKSAFLSQGVEIRPIVGGSMVEQPFFKRYCLPSASCPIAKKIHNLGFYFPNHPELTQNEVNSLCNLVRKKSS